MARVKVTLDGNEAAASIAYRLSDVIAIFPITPSTPMGELSDAWAATRRCNLWGTVPSVVEMQSEGGAAGAVHGALQAGSLATTFTASQGLLLMIPNMYKIAGELTSAVFHVAARSLAAQALSIFGDHADVMAARTTGWAILSAGSVQEAHDMALIAHASTLEARVPFIHFFDGFRTSHEINKIEQLDDDDVRQMIDERLVQAHRARALSPDHPVLHGTSQNPDVYFQARESVNAYYNACPGIVQAKMDQFAQITGRQYQLVQYHGAPDAARVVVVMGSAAETCRETVDYLNARGEKLGVVTVHLYRPFPSEALVAALPLTTKAVAVLDRTKEPGSTGEPLLLDVTSAIADGMDTGALALPAMPRIVGGRYGLSSKDFTPAMAKAVFENLLEAKPIRRFTIGINDDVTHTSLVFDPGFSIETDDTIRCVFWGLGSDGTVGANKNSIKIIGEETNNEAQAYFVYDSKKSGSITISHLRFGPRPVRAPYLISDAGFVACHQFMFLERYDVLKVAKPGAVFLLNTAYGPDEVWRNLPVEVQQEIYDKKLHFFVIDAQRVAAENGMGSRINTVMQTCFFAISGILPRDEAIAQIKQSIKKTYGRRGEAVVNRNFQAVDQALAHLYEVDLQGIFAGERPRPQPGGLSRRPAVPHEAPEFVREVLGPMIANEGDSLPVSAMPVDGAYPVGSARWERRNLAHEIPVWETDLCIQCGKCVYVCPHAVIRHKVYPADALVGAPPTFRSTEARFKEFPGFKYSLQVAPEDCTSCGLCVEVCPVKDKKQEGRKAINFEPQLPLRDQEAVNWDFFLGLPEVDRSAMSTTNIKNSQLLEPLFEFSGACAGCGETPYIKLLSQLFGDRLLVANATGCSSIFGGNLPTTPWAANKEGRGPAWSNSLFEDNAEFGLGMRLALDKHEEQVRELLKAHAGLVGEELTALLLQPVATTNEAAIQAQRARVEVLKQRLTDLIATGRDVNGRLRLLHELAEVLVPRTVWIVGGDGWAYDIGYGGLDHVLASGRNVKVLVLDTEVYSNTGGQASKSTPLAAVAKFAARGKAMPKKDLGMIAMAYGNIYVAKVAMGAADMQTLQAFHEAENFDGPALIIAYSHCIAHGYDMRDGLEQQKLAVQSGLWPLFRFNPGKVGNGGNPLSIDSKDPSIPLETYAYNEDRYKMLIQSDPEGAKKLMAMAREDVSHRWQLYKQFALVPKPD